MNQHYNKARSTVKFCAAKPLKPVVKTAPVVSTSCLKRKISKMTHIVRLKRRASEEEGKSTLVFNIKRRRTDGGQNDEELNVAFLQKTGTLEGDVQKDEMLSHLNKVVTKGFRSDYKKTFCLTLNDLKKRPVLKRDLSKPKRYKVVKYLQEDPSQFEALSSSASSSLASSGPVAASCSKKSDGEPTFIYEFLKYEDERSGEEVEDGVPDVKESKKSDYVYDFYYTDTGLIETGEEAVCLDEFALPHDDVYSAVPDSDDSEDSNAENNYANDYPDTESSSGEQDAGEIEDDDPWEFQFGHQTDEEVMEILFRKLGVTAEEDLDSFFKYTSMEDAARRSEEHTPALLEEKMEIYKKTGEWTHRPDFKARYDGILPNHELYNFNPDEFMYKTTLDQFGEEVLDKEWKDERRLQKDEVEKEKLKKLVRDRLPETERLMQIVEEEKDGGKGDTEEQKDENEEEAEEEEAKRSKLDEVD